MKYGQFSTFAFVDVETTGVSASQDRVLEVGILRVENGEVVGKMNTLIDPDVFIPSDITNITGITDDDILNAPHFSAVVEEVEALLKDAVFVAHNARFDYAFLKHEFRRLGLPFNYKTLDTVKFSRKLFPLLPRHNLDAIIALLNTKIEHRHRAYDDAYVLFELLNYAEKTFSKEYLEETILDFLKTPSLPQQISRIQIGELPQTPGVYFMYDKTETLLYVGKSVDVQARVLSHFYNDFESSNDLLLSREVFRVDAIKTAGDLGASLLEAQKIKTHLPIHNRMLRAKGPLMALVESQKGEYLTIKIIPLPDINPIDHHSILGVFTSKKQLAIKLKEIAKEHKLCLKLLGVEKSKGACFETQIGLCNGACEEKEAAFKYNVRFKEAFTNSRVPNWPFIGAIAIHEKFEENEELLIFNNWCYLGSVSEVSDEKLSEVIHKEVPFEWDNYKIIRRFIKKHTKTNSIINLPSLPVHSAPTEQQ